MEDNVFKIILQNENLLDNAEARRIYANRLFEAANNNHFIEDYADEWRFRPKGDFASMYGDLVQGGLQARNRTTQLLKQNYPNYYLTKYAAGLEDLRPPQVNRVSILRGTPNVPVGFASYEAISGYPTLGQIGKGLIGTGVNVLNRLAPYAMIIEGLTQPTATQQQEWDAYNKWILKNSSTPVLQGGIQYRD